MTKGYKIAIVLSSLILIILLVLLGLAFYDSSAKKTDNKVDRNINIGLSEVEAKSIARKVGYFVESYNSYGYDDYNSATNAAEIGTIDFQYKAIARKEILESTTPQGYGVLATSKDETFSYVLDADGLLQVSISADLKETLFDKLVKNRVQKYNITLVKESGVWKILNITP
jgi:hypothetical protein